eukprot:gb/GECH01013195.1/.p1 GENE.gb/GECH01013195.1/~~gb/GECH01013195.1/.p1  ORF type:complete len:595 (+),score=82.31 gb/GECH01013195.1/:1-1785(+)
MQTKALFFFLILFYSSLVLGRCHQVPSYNISGPVRFSVALGINNKGVIMEPGSRHPHAQPVPSSRVTSDILFDTLSLSGGHALALNREGEVYCWGDNHHGQCGLPVVQGIVEPRQVDGFPPSVQVKSLKAGEIISLALTTDGQVYGWGPGWSAGRIGNAIPPSRVDLPQGVNIQEIHTRESSSEACAVDEDGDIWCWTPKMRPSKVEKPSHVVFEHVYVRWSSSNTVAGLDSNHRIWSINLNDMKIKRDQRFPRGYIDPPFTSICSASMLTVASNRSQVMLMRQQNTLRNVESMPHPRPVSSDNLFPRLPSSFQVKKVACMRGFVMILGMDHTVLGWGQHPNNALPDMPRPQPIRYHGGDIIDIKTGATHALALVEDTVHIAVRPAIPRPLHRNDTFHMTIEQSQGTESIPSQAVVSFVSSESGSLNETQEIDLCCTGDVRPIRVPATLRNEPYHVVLAMKYIRREIRFPLYNAYIRFQVVSAKHDTADPHLRPDLPVPIRLDTNINRSQLHAVLRVHDEREVSLRERSVMTYPERFHPYHTAVVWHPASGVQVESRPFTVAPVSFSLTVYISVLVVCVVTAFIVGVYFEKHKG